MGAVLVPDALAVGLDEVEVKVEAAGWVVVRRAAAVAAVCVGRPAV